MKLSLEIFKNKIKNSKYWSSDKIKNILTRIYYLNFINTAKKRIIGNGNIINHKGAILSSVKFYIKGNNNTIKIESGSYLKSTIFRINGNNHHIHIGKNSRFNFGSEIWFEDNFGKLDVGDGSTFENIHLAITEDDSEIIIGEDCMFAYDIDVRTGDSHSIIDNNTKKRINYARNIYIGNHVWVAAHSQILKGSVIQSNSVVSTNATVTKKFNKAGVIIAGNPANIVKDNISWQRERIIKTPQ